MVQGLEWTFNTVAEDYARLRPGYPAALYRDLFAYAAIDDASAVVEIGIGGGQATGPVLETGCRLTAVEYGAALAEICCRKFADFPNFSVVTAKFEDYEAEENAYDLVYSASAFHWIPEEIGYPKVFRMLKPGGVFARFANHPYKDKGREALHAAIQEVYAVYMPNSAPGNEYAEADAAKRARIAGKYGFTDLRYRLYQRTRTFTSEEYVALLGTYSDHIAIEESTRKRFFAEIQRAIDDYGGAITLYDTLDLELARKP